MVLSPTKEIGIRLFEKVQAKVTKIPHSMRNLRYETRLAKWDLKIRLEDSDE